MFLTEKQKKIDLGELIRNAGNVKIPMSKELRNFLRMKEEHEKRSEEIMKHLPPFKETNG
jgi:hypothetical protein